MAKSFVRFAQGGNIIKLFSSSLMAGQNECLSLAEWENEKMEIWESKLAWLEHSTVYLEGFEQG